ncbi:protein kinase family protein [Bacillus sp. 31A1R]|uniref:Protein kinase family protein n=1 Tax=Robertmurraya mangrovi TaxID=3098077 RepID=A0ABU5J3R9_9BACI|nr:protein kinase family protein [Bacillus sp. 31A1R]MDZ5474010.1 protein kinase family protein [Bacillus sp. 31A1R]
MESFSELASSIKFNRKGTSVVLNDLNKNLLFIGKGRSAAVFKILSTSKVMKVYYPRFSELACEEAEIYNRLSKIPYYPKLYESGTNYIVIDYIPGETLFNCLVKGVTIRSSYIKEIDQALMLAKQEGLNPSDIHLRNILVSPGGRIKIIDVARFKQTKECSQWVHLKMAFERLYQYSFFPKKIPKYLLNLIAFFYKKRYKQFLLIQK